MPGNGNLRKSRHPSYDVYSSFCTISDSLPYGQTQSFKVKDAFSSSLVVGGSGGQLNCSDGPIPIELVEVCLGFNDQIFGIQEMRMSKR